MRESRDLVPIAPLLVTIVAVIGLTSAVWLIFWEVRTGEQHEQIKQLKQRLEHSESDRSRLIDRYSTAEESRHERELELMAMQNRLDETQRQLAELEEQDWPERYAMLEEENYDLSERIAELELRNSISRDKHLAEYEQLQGKHNDLQNEYNKLAREQSLLEQRLQTETSTAERESYELQLALEEARQARQRQEHLQHALERDLISHEISADRRQARITELEREEQTLRAALAESEQRIQALTERNDRLDAELESALKQADAAPPPVKAMTASTPPPAEMATSSSNQAGPGPGFRLARIESLEAALQNASSSDRKSIILTVIPTIPGGVDGAELAELLAGMDSRDIIEVIEGSRPHIQRPVDNDSYERIMLQLEDEDSRRLVTRLLQ